MTTKNQADTFEAAAQQAQEDRKEAEEEAKEEAKEMRDRAEQDRREAQEQAREDAQEQQEQREKAEEQRQKDLERERRAAEKDLQASARGAVEAEQGFLGNGASTSLTGFTDQMADGGKAEASQSDKEQLDDLFGSFTDDLTGDWQDTGDRMGEELSGIVGDPGDVAPPSSDKVAEAMANVGKEDRHYRVESERDRFGNSTGRYYLKPTGPPKSQSGKQPRGGRRQTGPRTPREIRNFGRAAGRR